MTSALRVAAFALVASACFSPVPEAQCSTDADCTNGTTCIDLRCRAPDGGAGTAGGAASTGGGTAGGDAGGSAAGGDAGGMGGSSGGGMTAGGAAGGGSACGCRNAAGQCQVGDSPLACGSSGTCARCGNGEQCVNGTCTVAACGPGTCTGCCGRGQCVTPSMQTAIACGAPGTMCSTCARGEDCVNGRCQVVMGCSVMTCASGCCVPGANRCLPPGNQTRFACGTGGDQCAMCPGGSQCDMGVCTGAPADAGSSSCDAVSCASGCCAFGRCLSGNSQSNFACGTAGQMCMQCPSGSSCRAGACSPITSSDGGAVQPLPIGSACTASSVCEGNCVEERQFGQATGFPGGYCTTNCGNGQMCPSGLCVTESVFGQPVSSCRSTCTGAGTGQGSCRTGYVCTLSPSPAAIVGFCRPSCQNQGFAANCAQGQQCLMSGYCQ